MQIATSNFFLGNIFINDDIDSLSNDSITEVLNELQELSFEYILKEIQINKTSLRSIESSNIPQFSDFDDVFKVLRILSDSPEQNISYNILGYYLCPKGAKMGAKNKYGENHYKLAVQLGLATNNKPYKLSIIGNKINKMSDDERMPIVSRLILRIPIIQNLLNKAIRNKVYVLDVLEEYLSKSTALRRRSNVKTLFDIIYKYNESPDIENAILNLIWSK